MKNKFLYILIKFLIFFAFFTSYVLSQELKFEAGTIENIDENTIKASNKIVISDNLGNKIYADKFIYNKEKNFLITDNVIYSDENNLLNIYSNKVEFDGIKNVITTYNETIIKQNNKYELKGKDIIYDRKNKRYHHQKQQK